MKITSNLVILTHESYGMGSPEEVGMVPRALSRIFSFPPTMIVLLLALSLSATINADEGNGEGICPDGASVDLTYAKRNGTGFFAESGQFFHTNAVWKTNGSWIGCICDVEPCLSLCPRKENSTETLGPEYFRNTPVEVPSIYTTNLKSEYDQYPVQPEDPFHAFVWDSCMGGSKKHFDMDVIVNTNDELYLLKNGLLFFSYRNGTESFRLNWRRYCLQQQPNYTIYTVRYCYSQIPSEFLSAKTLQGIGSLVNVPCFIATIFVYSVLPELRNIHGNTFRCYLFCLLGTEIMTSIVIFSVKRNIGTACVIFGYVMYFFTFSGYLWSNVVCFDMWWTFGGCRSLRSSGNLHDRKRFIWYSIYAWGTVTLMIVTCIGSDYYSIYLSDSNIRPNFNNVTCSFSGDALLVYLIGPVFLILICNSFFFVLTSTRLVQYKRNTQRQLSHGDSQRHDDNQASFSLCLKLFVIMGMSWSLQLSVFIPKLPRYFWLLASMPYVFQGVPIFIIFICKKKIWRSLKIRFKWYRDSNDSDTIRSDQVQTSRHFRSHNSAQTYT